MNDSPMSYDMLRSIAVQVSQELYRQAQADAERAPREPSCHDPIAWVRTRLAGGNQRSSSDCTTLSHSPSQAHL